MDKSLIEKYKQEMLEIHKKAKAMPTVAMPLDEPEVISTPPLSERTENSITEMVSPDSDVGYLTAVVTTLRALYPLPNAEVTVFTGDYENMNVLAKGLTDQSGRTQSFSLPSIKAGLSQSAGEMEKPYSSYNMVVKAEGFVDNIHLNIPVFSGVNSLQRSNMMLLETAGENKEPQFFDESEDYNL